MAQQPHPSDQNVDGISQADIDSWNETDASNHASNGEAPTEEKQAIGLQRYYEILRFDCGVLIAKKNQLTDEVAEDDGRQAENKSSHKGDWGKHKNNTQLEEIEPTQEQLDKANLIIKENPL